jgi:Zn-dependent peptidase ImmA (M78 family)
MISLESLLKNQFGEVYKRYEGQYPVPVVSIANDLGINVYQTDDLKADEAGLIRKEDDGRYAIYINVNDNPQRKRFTIAHEIGHFILHKQDLDKSGFIDRRKQPILKRITDSLKDVSSKTQKREIEANEFAAELLMPQDKFEEVFGKSNDIDKIANYFNVSTAAATIRAKEVLGLVIW